MPTAPEREPRRIRTEPGGPLLIDGPVEAVLDDGTAVVSDRPVVAICMCGRSRIRPWCDTSHRRRPRKAPARGDGPHDGRDGAHGESGDGAHRSDAAHRSDGGAGGNGNDAGGNGSDGRDGGETP
ncbi:CDGSH iron-sulfur domain-containing protein [Streptomyces sp. 796.1]|uniref:CDGSH iron-sulfur domain-containing protein n=1 Tax=Streptomyces sp. 796.1 TaxID=3163029 RepID=UPI0039C92C62